MAASKEIVVNVDLVGEEQLRIGYNSPMLADHVLDYAGAPQEVKPGQMRRLLCASAVGCFADSVYFMLIGRGVEVRAMHSTGTLHSDVGDNPLGAIHIHVEVEIDDEAVPTLDRVRELLAKGCLVTRGLARGMPITHEIVRI